MTRRVCLGAIDDIPDGEGRAVVVDGNRYALFREGEKLYAIDDRCPHRGGPLSDGIVGGGAVTCPLHGLRVDLETGRAAAGNGAVATFSVSCEEGLVYLVVP